LARAPQSQGARRIAWETAFHRTGEVGRHSSPPLTRGDIDVDAARTPRGHCLATTSTHPHAASLAKCGRRFIILVRTPFGPTRILRAPTDCGRQRLTRKFEFPERRPLCWLDITEAQRSGASSSGGYYFHTSLEEGRLMNANAALRRTLATLILAASSLLPASLAFGDPLPGRDVLKFSQRPMDGTPIVDASGGTTLYWGHDELSTAYSSGASTQPRIYQGVFMADDFADKFNSPVVHVKWWGSYLNNFQSPEYPVDKFLISFESDIPQGPNNPFSRPWRTAAEPNRAARAHRRFDAGLRDVHREAGQPRRASPLRGAVRVQRRAPPRQRIFSKA
jgi:hypothetical protein